MLDSNQVEIVENEVKDVSEVVEQTSTGVSPTITVSTMNVEQVPTMDVKVVISRSPLLPERHTLLGPIQVLTPPPTKRWMNTSGLMWVDVEKTGEKCYVYKTNMCKKSRINRMSRIPAYIGKREYKREEEVAVL